MVQDSDAWITDSKGCTSPFEPIWIRETSSRKV